MADPSDSSNMSMLMGEMRGSLREVIHTMNNLAQKVDTIFDRTGGIAGMAGDIKDMEARLTALETDRDRRTGANGVFSLFMRSPALGWIVGAATTLWAIITGRLHL